MNPGMLFIVISLSVIAVASLVTALCLVCVRIGFRMGRMTQDKPVETPKVFNPGGEPAIDEYDAYAEALSRPEAKSTIGEDK